MIKIYGIPNCTWCKRAQTFCIFNKLDYTYGDIKEIEIPKDWKTAPIIFIDDKFIGGFNELKEYYSCE